MLPKRHQFNDSAVQTSHTNQLYKLKRRLPPLTRLPRIRKKEGMDSMMRKVSPVNA